jgi:iron complex outermembrane receptor protein
MSELINTRSDKHILQRKLLGTVSAVALLVTVCNANDAEADDTDRPSIWIELGGQLEQSGGGQEPFAPPFVNTFPNMFFSPSKLQKLPLFSYGGEGAISFEPDGSDWVFSASVRYGRSNGVRQMHQQTPNKTVHVHLPTLADFGFPTTNLSKYPSSHLRFDDATVRQNESHAVLDFQVGKDVGLGTFGQQGSSVMSAGIRFAQFTSKMSVNLHAEPDVNYPTAPISSIPAFLAFRTAVIHFHDYAAVANIRRSFRGVGPSLAWNASVPFMGNVGAGELTFDWGAGAAILFGRQKANENHQTNTKSFYLQSFNYGFNGHPRGHFGTVSIAYHSNAASHNRSRFVAVPNFGGFVGVSALYSNVKLSVGYRADFYFGAMDGGIDTRKSETLGFYGPFASVSVGIGG